MKKNGDKTFSEKNEKDTKDYVEKIEKKFKTFFQNKSNLLIIICVIILLLIAIIPFAKPNTNDNNGNDNSEKFNVKIHIDFTENFLFSKYDVKLSLGNNEKILYHGQNEDVEFNIEEGDYTLSFINCEDTSIKHEEKIVVNSNMNLKYKITCYNDRISVENLYYNIENSYNNQNEDKIKITFNKYYFIGENYKDAIKQLEELGFTNIIENPSYDLTLNGLENYTYNEQVIDVKIDGTTDYKPNNLFNKDVEIIVNYHARDIDNPSWINPPYDTDTAKDVDYEIVVDAFKKAGFKNIEVSGVTGAGKDKTVSIIRIESLPASLNTKYNTEDKVYIYYYDSSIEIEEPKPETKLDLYYARKAFEEYGEKMYRYGFKCHWWVGLLDEKENTDGSYYFKVEVTITNQYGAEYDAIAEGIVNGTNNNTRVTNFNVK